MAKRKNLPKLFVGSSVETLGVAHSLQEHLRNTAEVVVWTEDVFTLSDSSLAAFQKTLDSADCAIFIVGASNKIARLNPNVLLELGMSIGYLGAPRTALLRPAKSSLELPSDMRGILVYPFSNFDDASKLHAGLASIAVRVRRWLERTGRRKSRAKELARPAEIFLKTPKRRKSSKAAARAKRTRNSVFISYSHVDAKWLARISTMLTPLIRSDRISVWDDTAIKPGTKWRTEIKRAIASAKVALLLVSPSFLASEYIAENELPPVLNAAEEKGLVIVWALVSACLYKKTALADYQAAHSIARPLDTLPAPKRNQALLSIAETVGMALESDMNR
jgi:predicted nucleotide-binding protein